MYSYISFDINNIIVNSVITVVLLLACALQFGLLESKDPNKVDIALFIGLISLVTFIVYAVNIDFDSVVKTILSSFFGWYFVLINMFITFLWIPLVIVLIYKLVQRIDWKRFY